MPAAKVYDIEANRAAAREKTVSIQEMTWYLAFKDPKNEEPYHRSLKNLFYFPTFWPIMAVFCAFTVASIIVEGNIVRKLKNGDAFLISSFIINLFNLVLILGFTIAQLIEYFEALMIKLRGFSDFILKRILWGRLEDLILILNSLAQGLYLVSFASRDMCTTCGTFMSVEECVDDQFREFPTNQAFFAYVSIVILPIYFKSIHRYSVLASWGILTIFVIAVYIYGDYAFQYFTLLFMVFFLVSILEFERYKMTSFLLSNFELQAEQKKSAAMQEKNKMIEMKLKMALIHQILPPKVAEQIIAGKQVEPESFEEVTIFFSDVEGFTTICSKVSPREVVQMLNDLYTVMDYCTSLFPLYKVETIGDAYMLVGGLPNRDKNHAAQIADFAILVQRAVQAVKSPIDGSSIRIRIGLHSGPVMAGVVGNLMPRYCLFGDTVNTASRMESNGVAGKIHCSAATADILRRGGKHNILERGEIEVKGKGLMTTYWLDSATDDNLLSNADAIARTEAIVQELLENSRRSKAIYDNKSGATSPPMTPKGKLSITPVATSDQLARLTSTNSSNGIVSPGRHTLQYNFAHMGDAFHQQDYMAVGAKVLVVEDSTTQRKILTRRLKEADSTWEINEATNGEEALQKLKAANFAFDVVFVDENLSSMDGLFGHELVQVMRESFNMKLTVIVACTSNPTKVSSDLFSAGVDIVWPKPPPAPTEIRSKIHILLSQRYKSHQQDAKEG